MVRFLSVWGYFSKFSGTNVTGRPGGHAMETKGRSTVSYLARALAPPCLCSFKKAAPHPHLWYVCPPSLGVAPVIPLTMVGIEQTNPTFRGLQSEKNSQLTEFFWKALSDASMLKNWSAANGGLRDGGLSKSEDIWGKRPFPPFSEFSRCSSHPPEKGKKGRKRRKRADFWKGRPDTP